MTSLLGILVIITLATLAYWHSRLRGDASEESNTARRVADRIGKLWDVTHQSIRDKRFLRAEKALLTILRIDEKNAAAYNRLGILYAKQKEYKDAIDCFEIASSIDPTPSSLHNLGLIYYDTENYNKSAVAFEHALKLEGDMAARHVAYAKVQERLGNSKLMLSELERAVEIEPSEEAYQLLEKAYSFAGRTDDAKVIEHKLKILSRNVSKSVPKRMLRPRRVVV